MEPDFLPKFMKIEQVPKFVFTKLNINLMQVVPPISFSLQLFARRYPKIV